MQTSDSVLFGSFNSCLRNRAERSQTKGKNHYISFPEVKKIYPQQNHSFILRVFKGGLTCFGASNIKIFTQMQVSTTALQVQEQMKNSLPKHTIHTQGFCLQEFLEPPEKQRIISTEDLSKMLRFTFFHIYTHFARHLPTLDRFPSTVNSLHANRGSFKT